MRGVENRAAPARCCIRDRFATHWTEKSSVIFDSIEWDEANLDHATRRGTAEEIEQAIWNADRMFRHRHDPERVLIRSVTDGGRQLAVIGQIVRDGLRPITAWEEER
jgi:hypothetical protein